jgi:multiple sugar transport system permease protein
MSVKAAPMARPGASSRRRQQGAWWRVLPNYLFVAPYLIAFLVLAGGPLLYTLYMSFFDRKIFDTNPPFIGLKNYTDLWTNDPLWITVLTNTIEFVVLTVIGVTLVALGAALLLRRIVRGQTVLRTILFAPAILSVAITAIIWQWLLAPDAGALNFLVGLVGIGKLPWTSDAGWAIPSLSLATVWWNFGIPMIILLAGLLNIDATLYEAASIDGAGAWRAFRSITLPLLRPTLLFVLVTQIIAQFQVFGQPAFITGGGPGDSSRTILMFLYDTVWRHFQYGYGAAIAITLALIMGLITAVQFGVLGRGSEVY